MVTFDIVIPTHFRSQLLSRTLASLAAAVIPRTLRRILVIENGGEDGAQNVCGQFEAHLPIAYQYERRPGLSNARNIGVRKSESDIILFIDDDISVFEETLVSYSEAFQTHGTNAFYGGPLQPDYEAEPEKWLLPFLPWSVKGHSLGEQQCEVDRPQFLGGNIAVSRGALGKYAFDSVSATGVKGGGLGEEVRLQQKLLEDGYRGIYVPGGLVGHYISEDRCTRKFIKHRKWREGYGEGQIDAISSNTSNRTCFSAPCWYWKDVIKKVYSAFVAFIKNAEKSKRFLLVLQSYEALGRIKGYRRQVLQSKEELKDRDK